MGRKPCCDKIGLKRGPWTIEEDYKLINFILNNGIHCWRMVPKLAGLLRCGKSCRLRWVNYLRPDLKRGAFTEDEEDKIIRLHSSLGNRWSKIAAHFPGRTDNEIKNQWNTRIKKHMMQQLGPEPSTHKPPVVNSQEVTPQSPMEQEMIDDSGKIEIIPAAMDDTTDELFQNDYESLWENNNNNNNNNKTTSTSCSKSSFSWEDTSMGSSSRRHQQWFDNVDSLLSWDCFNQLEDNYWP